jgi:2-C-methyl-D-erythritol 4-phosphate cytidylyltransferase
MNRIKYWVVIPAAGRGLRFGANIPKQYLSLRGRPIIEHTIAKFLYHSKIEKIIISLQAKDPFWQQLQLDTYSGKILVTTGGALRYHSVYAGLQAIAGIANPQDFVLVHDAVRPCLCPTDIDKLINEVGNHPVGGILGSRMRDTLKHSNHENEIIHTFSRENIWQALTPQMFRYKLLTQALDRVILNKDVVTDEASAIESLGFVPMIVEGRRDNIKITFPEDLSLAEKYFN